MTMASIVEDCWHGKLSSKEAEARLVGVNKAKAYLFRESDVKEKRFILSYISGSHLAIRTVLGTEESNLHTLWCRIRKSIGESLDGHLAT